ncbi:hypothetical protein PBI_JACE_56 [Gordonia phage Jace]|uniref:Uncharacterized protein n=1 Tax=Gordonia phage Jace TaxID=2182360 RepID=A0A2U8UJP1_9CAUD|nr:hypothetical protein HOT28_gp56 [Gordonia phage Jace]AWN03676.1 hypothetical protein PBI_JACE_56 [Gordonia phage Jace]
MLKPGQKIVSLSKSQREELIFELRNQLPKVHARAVELRKIMRDAAAELEKVERRQRDIFDSIDALS